MRRPPARPGPLTLALAVSLLVAIPPRDGATAKRPREAKRARAAATVVPAAPETLAARQQPADEKWTLLGQAVVAQRAGDLRGTVERLEALDPLAEPEWSEADRSAFLLGQAYLELGAVERFRSLARAVSQWEWWESPYTHWLVFQLEQLEAETGGNSGARPAPGDSLAPVRAPADGTALANEHSPLGLFLRARASAGDSTGDDAGGDWARLAGADTASALGRDLAGATRLREARARLARGEDPRDALAGVPAGSRYAARAKHLLALATLERGDSTAGEAMLAALAAEESTYAARREVLLALGGRALERGDWATAHTTYRTIESDWSAERDTLRGMVARGDYDALWRAWRSDAALSDALILDAAAAETLAAGFAAASLDLGTRPALGAPAAAGPAGRDGFRWAVAPPPADTWRALAASARTLGETRGELERTRWDAARERETLAGLRRYLDGGRDRTRRETEGLIARATLLDSLGRSLDAIDARIQAVRDEATRRVLRRSADLLRGCIDHMLWLGGMRLIHVDGPNAKRGIPAPDRMHTPEDVLRQEEVLARALRDAADRMAKDAPGLIALSYEKHWRPGMIDRAREQGIETHRALAWARALGVSIDSSIAATADSDSLRRLEARLARLARDADSLSRADHTARDAAARRAVEATLATLDPEREGIDYGLATAAYGQTVGFGEAMVAGAAGDSAGAAPGEDAAYASPEAARWRGEAILRLRTFLDRHPGSLARGEMRFRLADLLLIEARQGFRAQMDAYLQRKAAGQGAGALPVLQHGEPLALYRKILAEDPSFEHRDAVLFNAAMILADEGSPEAARLFDDLVKSHPGSAYAQESWLRMGDMQFNEGRYAESVALYRQAAAGSDPTLRAIALYKTGWAHFNGDRFADAADAFRSVLDLYAAEQRGAIRVEIEGEAEAYLVHSLAGAGGATAFARYFDQIGARPYETRVLMAMAQQFRRLARDADAARADELMIARYPLQADALLSAQRLIETKQRTASGPARAAAVRETRIAYAPRFAPGSEWYAAQASDSVRNAGSEFARGAWVAAAHDQHRRARETGAREDWRRTLELYENVLSRWSSGDAAAALQLSAGEAATQLSDYPAALRHYAAAATSGHDSTATQALWQRVAVTDAWYERSRGAGPAPAARGAAAPRGLGSDSLARAVVAASDDLMRRFPGHARAAELQWRQGNLSFAHGWYEDAAAIFGRMHEAHPNDARAPRAAILQADALFRLGNYEQSGAAYETALAAARRAGVDSLARRAAQAMPVAWYRHAEASVAADSGAHARHAPLFEQVATRWPDYDHAHVAQYRAGLQWLAAGKNQEAVRAMEALIARFPKSEYVKDAHLQIARTWESAGERERGAAAYARFAGRYPADSSAGDATLKAADLYAGAGQEARADTLRLAYVRSHPGDVETSMEIMETLARRDLAALAGGRAVSSLLPAPVAPPAKGKARAATKAAAARAAAAPAKSHLAAYLELAEAHPKLAARDVVAQVRFLQAEEARSPSDSLPLRQPLAAAITARQKRLDHVMGLYRECVDLAVVEWAHAATFRIGQALVGFGQALERSERPADLQGDALRAYEDVLADRSQVFYDRGEAIWSDLLRQAGATEQPDVWVTRAQESLWPRLGNRFFYRPEMEFPEVAADPARRVRAAKDDAEPKDKRSRRADEDAAALSRGEGNTP